MNNIPKKLNNPPILLSAVNIKFETNLPPQAVFGILYQAISLKIKNLKSAALPSLNIPQEIKNQDPNLRFAPEYVLFSDEKKYVIHLGSRVISVIYDKAYGYEYKGWVNYLREETKELLECVSHKPA
ncbi:TIGR04255 family protein [Campylobacter pinnipediorum]|uniref:TIGR04255 family protein n=1 Tax=Campylobacter pinnipediorum TaxID=1965231 RepID=UPI000995B657|nr:TIGR04255 family protein [Campylobacter pinnipediorum]AQW82321.1 hypothetical protein CPIN17261_0277 [Campylobacter pinnipediorum subsp. pinnipediorum]